MNTDHNYRQLLTEPDENGYVDKFRPGDERYPVTSSDNPGWQKATDLADPRYHYRRRIVSDEPRPIEDWLKELPKPLDEMALEAIRGWITIKPDTLSYALNCVHSCCPDNQCDFWESVLDWHWSKDPLPPLPQSIGEQDGDLPSDSEMLDYLEEHPGLKFGPRGFSFAWLNNDYATARQAIAAAMKEEQG